MTSRINQLSRAGFNNRLKLACNDEITNLHNFNRRIEKLVDDTYDVFNEIGEQEWAALQEPLDLLIATTKDLLKAYRKRFGRHEECESLEGKLSYLMELRSDIVNYRILAPQNQELKALMQSIDNLLSKSA